MLGSSCSKVTDPCKATAQQVAAQAAEAMSQESPEATADVNTTVAVANAAPTAKPTAEAVSNFQRFCRSTDTPAEAMSQDSANRCGDLDFCADGDSFFAALKEGLLVVTPLPIRNTMLTQLRSEVVRHMRDNLVDYLALWDGRGTNLVISTPFPQQTNANCLAEFMTLLDRKGDPGATVSAFDILAAARTFRVCLVLHYGNWFRRFNVDAAPRTIHVALYTPHYTLYGVFRLIDDWRTPEADTCGSGPQLGTIVDS